MRSWVRLYTRGRGRRKRDRPGLGTKGSKGHDFWLVLNCQTIALSTQYELLLSRQKKKNMGETETVQILQEDLDASRTQKY